MAGRPAMRPMWVTKSVADTSGAPNVLETLLDHVSEVIDEGHKVLVFSQFTTP